MELSEAIKRLNERQADKSALMRMIRAGGLLVVIFVMGTVGYRLLAGGEASWLACAYMTVITLTSIGYGEVVEVSGHDDRMIYTICLSLMGMGVMLYFVSTLTAFIVDGELRELLRANRMKSKMDKMKDHFIIAGVGDTGRYVLSEMQGSDRPVVVIEASKERIEDLQVHASLEKMPPFICDDATADDTLIQAGIERARGVVFSLGNDRDNLFATITARRINPDLIIVTRGEDPHSEQKFLMAGATSVIFTNVLGGMRMAAELIRPQVTTFLDLMIHDHGHFRRIEELPVPADSPMIGKMLKDTSIRKHTDALMIAIFDIEEHEYHFNPQPSTLIPPNSKLIFLTLVDDIEILESLLAGELE